MPHIHSPKIPQLTKHLILLTISTLSLACTPPTPWHPAQLTTTAQTTPACLTQIHQAIDAILANELTGITINDSTLQTLIQSSTVDQHVNLYGGRQIRHWSLATFDDLETCTIYNHATTLIDLKTNAETTQNRPLRQGSKTNQNARRPLPTCTCTPTEH